MVLHILIVKRILGLEERKKYLIIDFSLEDLIISRSLSQEDNIRKSIKLTDTVSKGALGIKEDVSVSESHDSLLSDETQENMTESPSEHVKIQENRLVSDGKKADASSNEIKQVELDHEMRGTDGASNSIHTINTPGIIRKLKKHLALIKIKRAIYILVLDGSRKLDVDCPFTQYLPGKRGHKTARDYLRFWINTIVTYCKGSIPGFPKIIVVLTHKDKVEAPPKRQRKPKGTTGQSPNKKKKTQAAACKQTKTTSYQNRREDLSDHTSEPTERQRMTLPEQSGSTDKETLVPFQSDLGNIYVASGSDQPEMAGIDQNPVPRQHTASEMAGIDQNPVPRQHIATTGMFNNTTGLSDYNKGYSQGLNLDIVHESVTPVYTSSVFDPVGAHIPSAVEYRRQELFEDISQMFEQTPLKQHLVIDDKIFVNAKDKHDPEMVDIKRVIIRESEQQPTWGESLPKCFIPLELEFASLIKRNVSLITVEHLQKINSTQAIRPLSETELKVFLKFQHSIGKVLYFDEHNLDNHVILCPTHLIDAFKSIVTDRMFCEGDNDREELWDVMRKEGVVPKKVIQKIWKKKKYCEFNKNQEYLLHVMTHLDILVEPKRYDSNNSRIPADFYYVASMVRANDDSGYLLSPDFTNRSISLVFQSSSLMIPPALSFRFISYCLNIWAVKQISRPKGYAVP
ncbi:unnamed protein product [Mytilus edulis]|uniref:COR domain-containing protein n=1 Tax=Mytilus edulis TaxID=6550 RepID=A0A8S3TNE6_MYTED|nr:unnamed protein product [Mytilus edulis]